MLTPLRPLTVTGVNEPTTLLLPSCPQLLTPQHFIVRLTNTAQLSWVPAVTEVAPVNPVTCSGVAEKVTPLNCPNSPALSPQHLTVPAANKAHVWEVPPASAWHRSAVGFRNGVSRRQRPRRPGSRRW